MFEDLIPIVAILSIFVGLPWLIFHYITQWKRNGNLPIEDERLLDELHDLARRLDDRLRTIERIVAVDDPSFASRARLSAERSDTEMTADRIEDRLRAR
ncbi:envelope stress response membrane protein PspB [Sphingomonas naphthae]|uniref:Envelope stress response membrane protein PspB n=1 Tax=Sphingomonas naphthae TaxID=1813468 RepID=A0ABY7TJ18_9SPHN|nr:envelope stress response membrane protein PspB [Sphingomonas naphthae]WCT72314.1 envelope stress response membrane protein PspB [Sphingomonas naphthae]